MSTKINVQCEIRDMRILKDTLNQMGINFTEQNQDVLAIQRAYMPITINTRTGDLSHDSAHTGEVKNIRIQYAANFCREQCIREGNQIKEEVDANGHITIQIL
jgi:hypothetical protein